MANEDPRRWMWEQALGALARAERLQREVFHLSAGRERRPNWEPPVDVLETADMVVVVAALPGVCEAAVSLTLEDGALVVRGERSLPAELRTAVIHRLELPQGYFVRRVPLPAGRYDQIRQRCQDGCLVVTLRKRA